jgi:hypothetical protein
VTVRLLLCLVWLLPKYVTSRPLTFDEYRLTQTLKKICGNHLSWETHMKGLKKIIEFRGGLSVLDDNPLVLDKVRR